MPEKLEEVLTGERLAALERTLDLLVKLDEMGVLETVGDVLEPDTLRYLFKYLMHPGLLKVADRLDVILDALGRVDYEAVNKNIDLVNKALKSVPEEAEPVGLGGLLGALRDPDVQRGLGFLVAFLKALGKSLAEEKEPGKA